MTDISAINYQPLDKMNGVWLRSVKSSFKGGGYLVGPIFIIAGFITIPFVPVIGIFILISYILYIGSIVSKFQNQIWTLFGAVNGWPVDVGVPDLILISPSLNFGHSQKLSPVIQANINSDTVYLFSYKCTTGSGKYSQDHYFTVAVAKLAKDLPHMLLLSKKSHPDLQMNLDDHEKLRLEGDFGKFFELQVQKGQEIDVLSIITPDVMQALVKFDQDEDVEIFNNYLYFIKRDDNRDSVSTKLLIDSVDHLSSQIIENINLTTLRQNPAGTTLVSPSESNATPER